MRHLELFKADGIFIIRINTLIGRLSLFADHPRFKLSDAINFKKNFYTTSGQLSLIKLRRKDLYILEDADAHGNRDQNFIFVSEELSQSMKVSPSKAWLKHHFLDFLTRSLSVLFSVLYIIYFFTILRYYSSTDILYVLQYITGVLMLVFALSYYYFRSSKTKSSFLKFCFRMELLIFIIVGTINNIYHLLNISNATDIF